VALELALKRVGLMKEEFGNIEEDLFEGTVEEIVARDQRYHREAYLFVRDALRLTVEAVCKVGEPYHIDAAELLHGLRELAVNQFGPMAKMVLEEWGIHTCQDFGEILFHMAEGGFLADSAKGCRTAFEDGFDFDEAFRRPFLPKNDHRILQQVADKVDQL
jgi:uncharacterized repeat protein (TIGR04138 family)